MAQWADNAEPSLRAIADAQHSRTQELLAEAGFEDVVAYRGVRWDIGEDLGPEWAAASFHQAIPDIDAVPADHEIELAVPDQEVELAPLSSWSTARSVAKVFAVQYADARTGWDALYGVMTAKVPVSAVFSTPETGLGCLTESEVVVLGRPARVNAKWTARRGMNEAGDTYGDRDSNPW